MVEFAGMGGITGVFGATRWNEGVCFFVDCRALGKNFLNEEEVRVGYCKGLQRWVGFWMDGGGFGMPARGTAPC
jgi:hypothetical protein